MLTLELLHIASLIAVVSFVYVFILCAPEMILNKWYLLLGRLHKRGCILAKPLGYCETCFAGQVALHLYYIRYWSEYNLWQHITFTATTILLTKTITIIYEKLRG